MDVFGVCLGGAALVGCVARWSRRFGRRRIAFEIVALGVGLTTIVWGSAWWSVVFVFGLGWRSERRRGARSAPLALAKVAILVLTAICIIFVDFPAFPREHGKVSHYIWYDGRRIVKCGFEEPWSSRRTAVSLMDTGAAFFLVLNGFAKMDVKRCAEKGVVNVGLWLVRIVATKSTSYFTPEGEYARGCNFFGYLGVVEIAAALVSICGARSGYVAVALSVLHEVTNHAIPLVGYLVLFFMANEVGFEVDRVNWLVCVLPVVLAEIGILRPLREKANTAFAVFCFSIFYSTLAMFSQCSIDYDELSVFYQALNTHPLVFFGVANVVTGVINLLVNCNSCGHVAAILSVLLVVISSSMFTILWHIKCRQRTTLI